MQQLFDLLAGEFPATGEFAEHALAVGTGLVDHLAALLLRHRQFGLGVRCGVRPAARRLDLGLLAHAGRLVARLAEQLRGALLGLLADLRSALACGGEHPGRLLTQQPSQCLVVELRRSQIGVGLGGAEFTLEEALALLQAPEFGGHHAQEIPDLPLVETTATGAECGVGDRRR